VRRAIQLINKAGGVERINQEARRIFAKYIGNAKEGRFLDESDLKEFPAIASLGNAWHLNLEGEARIGNTPLPAHISIRYGTHFHPDFISIFNPDDPLPPKFKNSSLFIPLAPNIFLEK